MWKEYRLHCRRYELKEGVLQNFMDWMMVRTLEDAWMIERTLEDFATVRSMKDLEMYEDDVWDC